MQEKILSLMIENPKTTQFEMCESLYITMCTLKKNMKELQDKGLIKRVGATKNGSWIVTKNKKGEGLFCTKN